MPNLIYDVDTSQTRNRQADNSVNKYIMCMYIHKLVLHWRY